MKYLGVFMSACALLYCGLIEAQTGLEVMQRNKDCVSFSTLQSENELTITNKNGQKRTRKIKKIESLDSEDNKSMVVTFTYPADVEGTALLSVEKSDDRWLYIPALKQSRRIPDSDLSSSFMGTDFSYEDLENEEITEFEYQNLGVENLNGQKCYHIIATPKTKTKQKESGYSKRELFVTTDHYAAVLVKYYDKKGNCFKELRSSDLRKVKNSDKWKFYKMEMVNLKKKSTTTITVDDYVIDQKLSAETFSKRAIER